MVFFAGETCASRWPLAPWIRCSGRGVDTRVGAAVIAEREALQVDGHVIDQDSNGGAARAGIGKIVCQSIVAGPFDDEGYGGDTEGQRDNAISHGLNGSYWSRASKYVLWLFYFIFLIFFLFEL